jgi:glycoside/pentoside/hexuronide:cation symporter, GPH family
MTQTTLTEHSTVAKEQNPPMRIDLAYAMVQLGNPLLWTIVDSWLLYFYLPPEGKGVALVPPALYSVVVLATRVLNAVVVPPIGYLSDHTRSRWGRRLPFMAVSALPLLVFFVLLWTPPVQGTSTWNMAYLAVIFVLYNLTYSLLMIPYNALLPELALTDQHRVRIATWYASAQMISTIAAGMAGMLIESQGYVTTALVYAGVALPFFYLPFLVLRERPERQIAATERMSFRQSMAVTLRNPAFLMLSAAGVCFWSATVFLMMIIPFVVTEVCLLTEFDTTYFFVPATLVMLACYPAVMALSNRFGKWRVFAGGLIASAVVFPGPMIIGDWLPVPLMAQGIAWIVLVAMAMSPIVVLPQTFVAEITDYDAQMTGQRREGAYYSTLGFLDQVVNGAAAAALPLLLLLGRSHSDPGGPLGVRLTTLIAGLLFFVGFLIFLRYPLRHRSEPQAGE